MSAQAEEVELDDSDIVAATALTAEERAMVEVIGLFGDEGWEAVARNYPLPTTWRTFHSVPQPRTVYQQLVARGLATSKDGKIELIGDGRWILQLM